MAIEIAEQERKRITEIADEYRRRGYAVTIQPVDDEVPAFVSPYRPDLIAKGPTETVIVEVKAGTRSRADLTSVAAAINARPGWRFELVLMEPSTQSATINLVPVQELEQALVEGNRLAQVGLLPAAFVVLWSATEGALRHAARRNGVEGDRDPRRLIRQLASLGMITQAELKLLEHGLNIRNKFAHGFQPDPVGPLETERLLRFTQRLLLAGETMDDSFNFKAVSEWLHSVLVAFQGYRLEDAVFERDAVIIRANDGAEFLVTMEEWTDVEPSRRLDNLRTRLLQWASAHLVAS